MSDPSARGSRDGKPFNSRTVSASRINKYLGCGVEFRRYYIDGEKETNNGSAALFGLVMHNGLEDWALDRSRDLVQLIQEAWREETEDTVVADFIEEYQTISVEVMKAEAAARSSWESRPANRGKESKAPRMTKDFKESVAAQKLNAMLGRWWEKLNNESPWRFSERDPLPALYDESLQLAKRYAAQWRHLPTAVHTELGFTVEFHGFTLKGYIDNIEPVIDDADELHGYGIVDYKTYRAEPTPMKDWRQGVLYDVAVTDLIERGVLDLDPSLPRYVIFDYCRLQARHDYRIGDADRAKLLVELEGYARGIEAEVFLPPQKSANPDFCSFGGEGGTCCMQAQEGIGRAGGLYA